MKIAIYQGISEHWPQNKNRTFKTPDIPYFIIWSEIIFFWNIKGHDVGSPP